MNGKMGPNKVTGLEELTGPPIDVKATLLANLKDVRTFLNNIQEYVEDVQRISVQMKGIGLMQSNMYTYVSAQSAIDVAKDVLDLIAGKKITTIAEMQEKVKEEQEALDKKLQGNAQEAYTG
jgi:hypothetical protein